jgi:hypothetical protein
MSVSTKGGFKSFDLRANDLDVKKISPQKWEELANQK